MKNPKHFLQQGMTLIEISVVLLVLIALAGVATPYFGNSGRIAMCQATDATLQTVKQAIMGGSAGAGFYTDLLGEFPRDKYFPSGYSLNYLISRDDGVDNDGDSNLPSVDGKTNVDPDDEWLAFNSNTGVGWRGPYLLSGGKLEMAGSLDSSFGDVFDPTTNATGRVHVDHNVTFLTHIFDAWHRPIILQIPYFNSAYQPDYARLVSAGSGSGIGMDEAAIDTPIQNQNADNRNNGTYANDDRVLFLKIADPAVGGNRPCDQM